VDPVDAATPFAPASRAWITRERSGPGHIGAPHLASTEKGERLLRLFSSDLVAWMERVIRWDGRSWNE
jgi:creatinine amidohydrolase